MTTQIVRRKTVVSGTRDRRRAWGKFAELIHAIGELMDMTFAPAAHLSHLESQYRSTLHFKERIESDAYMYGVR